MKILMVCLGNICRSPIAEGVLKKLLMDELVLHWEVDSAGVGDWHSGSPPDRRAIRTASKHGIDISQQKARVFHQNDYDYFDHILVMDEEVLDAILAKSPSEHHRKKVNLLLDFRHPGENRVVPDPYFNGLFEESYQLIQEGCQAFLRHMTHQEKLNKPIF